MNSKRSEVKTDMIYFSLVYRKQQYQKPASLHDLNLILIFVNNFVFDTSCLYCKKTYTSQFEFLISIFLPKPCRAGQICISLPLGLSIPEYT